MKILITIILLVFVSPAYAEITVMLSANTLPDRFLENLDEKERIDVVKISDCVGTSAGRSLYDFMFTNRTVFKRVRTKLTDSGFDPRILMAHKEAQTNGRADIEKDDDNTELIPMTTARQNELLRCLPSICTTNPTTLVVTCVRPVTVYQPHKFYGWGDR